MTDKMAEEKLTPTEMNLLIGKLREETDKLKMEKNTLENQIRADEVRKEQQTRLDQNDARVHLAIELKKIGQRENALISRETMINLEDERLRDRIREVERREQFMLKLEEKQAVLDQEKRNFNDYRNSINLELEKMKIATIEGNEFRKDLKGKEIALAGREKAVKKNELIWNDRIGALQEQERKFQQEKEYLEGLRRENNRKELVNA